LPNYFFRLIAVLHSECPASFHCTILSLAWHLSLRVDFASEAVYELIAEPLHEPQAGEPQAEAAVEPDPEVANPADWQGKPRCITLNFNIQ